MHFTSANPLDHAFVRAAVGAGVPGLLPLRDDHLKPLAHRGKVVGSHARLVLQCISSLLIVAIVKDLLRHLLGYCLCNILVIGVTINGVFGWLATLGCSTIVVVRRGDVGWWVEGG